MKKLGETDEASPLENGEPIVPGTPDGVPKLRFRAVTLRRRQIRRHERVHAAQLGFQPLAAVGHQSHGTLDGRRRLLEPAGSTLGVGQIGQVTGGGQTELHRIERGDRLRDHGNPLFQLAALAERPSDERGRVRPESIQSMLLGQREQASPHRQHLLGCATQPEQPAPDVHHRDHRRMRMPDRIPRPERVEAYFERGVHVSQAQVGDAEHRLRMDLGVLAVQVSRRGVSLGDVQRQ